MSANRVSKLKWLCRRGMKELDLLLESFLMQNKQSLERGSWPEFEALLHNEDDVFWIWVQNPQHKDAMKFRSILKRIQSGLK